MTAIAFFRRTFAIGLLLCIGSAYAQTFRMIIPLAPDAQMRAAIQQGRALRAGAPAGLRQVPPDAVEDAVRRIYSAYNTPDFRQYLSERFYDPDRFLDAVADKVPREARLRVIGVNSARTVSQQMVKDEQGLEVSESLVMVVVRAQIEFTSTSGFQRREGESELLLRFREGAQ